MKNPLEQLSELEYLIRQLTKVDSKMQSGQFIAAYRENRRIIAELEAVKQQLVKGKTSND